MKTCIFLVHFVLCRSIVDLEKGIPEKETQLKKAQQELEVVREQEAKASEEVRSNHVKT